VGVHLACTDRDDRIASAERERVRDKHVALPTLIVAYEVDLRK
jgi:hypothetical protein